jgi:dUTP pyrophosphatase
MLKIYRLNEHAVLPKFATKQSACFDISASEDCTIIAKHSYAVSTGLILDIPEGYSVRIHPRSGLAYKKGITLLNCEGIIDSDYTDVLKVILYNTSNIYVMINKGDRIAQLLVEPIYYPDVETVSSLEELSSTSRGEGGFGSTGVN